jgi:hypothetical protein
MERTRRGILDLRCASRASLIERRDREFVRRPQQLGRRGDAAGHRNDVIPSFEAHGAYIDTVRSGNGRQEASSAWSSEDSHQPSPLLGNFDT